MLSDRVLVLLCGVGSGECDGVVVFYGAAGDADGPDDFSGGVFDWDSTGEGD